MYKVVIVDDEDIIVRGLTKLIPWEKYHCQVVGTAGDGAQALELIREIEPNIVFSDIYMPQMDGLMMTAALKSEYEDMEITILTGYRDFDLLQQALRLGVRRYVLKPSSMEELEEAVAVMTEHLKKKGIATEAEPVHEAGSFVVNQAMDYLKIHYAQKLSLKDVADHVYVSQWHLSKLLNKHTGSGFSELLNTIRIEEAKKLLEDPSLRVGDVAEAVGFQDLAHFSRVFKKITGLSANEYRNRL